MTRLWPMLLLAALPLLAQPPAAPGTKPAAAPAKPPASTPAISSYKDLKYPPLRLVEMPKLESATLANGLRLYLLEDHELPLVNGTALIRGGSLLDPPDKLGLANLAITSMRAGGAGSRNPTQLNDRLEDLAASIELGANADSLSVTFSSLKESSAEVLGIFKDVLTAPQFNDGKVDEARTQMRNGIVRRNDDAGRIARRELSDLLFGRETPYGREPDYGGLGNILRSDLEAFHTRYFSPKNTLLAIRGDFDLAAMKAQIEKLFADWKTDQPAPEFPKPQLPAAAQIVGIHVATKKDVRETFFTIGQVGGLLADKDYAALSVMADILGGGPSNRLLQRLRDRASRAAVSARWDGGYAVPGLFEIYGSLPSGSVVDSLKAIQEEVARLRSAEVSEDELKTAKDAALNSLVFAFDTKAKTLNRLLTYEYYGYPADFIDRYRKAVEAVTRADVLRVAKEHLKPEMFATVLVGDPADFIPPVESLNQPVHKIDLTIPEPKMAVVKFDSASAEKGRAILARVQQAVGGLDKLAAIKDSTLVTNYQVDQNGRVTAIKHTERWMAPMHYREDNELGGGNIASYLDGQFGWITVPGGSQSLDGPALKQAQGNAFRQIQVMLQAGTIPGTTVNAVDELTIEIGGPWGQSVRVAMDPATGLPARIRYDVPTRSGPPSVAEEVWSDYREVAGIKVPFKMYITQGGRKYADVAVEDYHVNTGLKLADLERRR